MHDLTEMLSKTKSETALKKAAKAAGNKILQQFCDDVCVVFHGMTCIDLFLSLVGR